MDCPVFTTVLKEAFLLENNPNDPVSKDDVLVKYRNVKFHKIHINDEVVSPLKSIEQMPKNIRLITICLLVLWENRKIYMLDMYISEMCSYDSVVLKKNYAYVGTFLKTKNYERAINIVKNSVPIWPDKNTSDVLYPTFVLVDSIPPPKDRRSHVATCKNEFNYNEAIKFLNKRWVEAEDIAVINEFKNT